MVSLGHGRDKGHVRLSYNPYFSACFFIWNGIFLSQQTSPETNQRTDRLYIYNNSIANNYSNLYEYINWNLFLKEKYKPKIQIKNKIWSSMKTLWEVKIWQAGTYPFLLLIIYSKTCSSVATGRWTHLGTNAVNLGF